MFRIAHLKAVGDVVDVVEDPSLALLDDADLDQRSYQHGLPAAQSPAGRLQEGTSRSSDSVAQSASLSATLHCSLHDVIMFQITDNGTISERGEPTKMRGR